ncbi:aldo/keto reductase [Sphingomonas sp. So64.6b]|uniref:aldo/keto reductase n=1 Tax=Sphingomonas sp. So64.6b TaxID=2997354 RepID=UPI0015FFCC39|nr:aldo/keto reductase [Sphingomonas sp. So64.6b]QNA86103.1 aldo/keto reductase [Sphingomonas sp. So64.6b]
MSEIILTPDSRPLGKSGLMVSPIAWGMWRFGHASPEQGRALIEAAFAAGVTLFDTADIYGFNGSGGFGDAEALLGRIFAESPDLRARMVLATKGGIAPPVPYDSSAPYLAAALDASLRRLQTDQVDLYQIHRPDILAHPQETARALEDMVAAGKVRAVGVSNYTVAQTTALASFLTIPLASHQPEFSPLELEPITGGLLDLAMERDMAILAWSPLGGGRIGDPQDERSRGVTAALDIVANQAGVSRAAAAYSWIMAHPARAIPIVGTQNVTRIAEIADAFKPRWTRQSWYDVLIASRGERLP